MGCGASSRRKVVEESEGEEQDVDERKSYTSHSSRTSNKFTAEYTSRRAPRSPRAEYSPTSRNDNFDTGLAQWQRVNQMMRQKEEESKPEDFVFGDFKVDPNDVQQQRIERVNRSRRIERKRSLKVKPSGEDKQEVVWGDFHVKIIDEVEEADLNMHMDEVSVPIGFNKLKQCSCRTMLGHTSRVKAIAIAPNEQEFVSASMDDNGISLINLDSGRDTGTSFDSHSQPIIAVTFSKDGRYLATSSRDNSVIVWDAMHKEGLKRTLEHDSLPICCAFSSDSKYIVTGCQDRHCHVWDVRKQQIELTYSQHEGVVVSVTCLSTAETAISGGADRIIRMWSIETGEDIRQFIGHDGVVISISVTPDGERFLSNDDRACKMWNVETGACILNVTLDSLTTSRVPLAASTLTPPIPLSRTFLEKCPLQSKQFGMAPHGIFGPQATNACKMGTNRVVFTLSCLCPGTLSRSYFVVASTNKMVYIVSCATGKEEFRFVAKASVFALATGRKEKFMFGDIFGNVYCATVKGENGLASKGKW